MCRIRKSRSDGLPQRKAEGILEAGFDIRLGRLMVLGSHLFNLDATHQGAETAGCLHIHAMGHAIHQASAERIATASWIQCLRNLDWWHFDGFAALMDFRPLGSTCDDVGINLLGDFIVCQATVLRKYFGFVVVYDDIVCDVDEAVQFILAEHHQALTWVKDERNVEFRAVFCVLDHTVFSVWGDNRQLDVVILGGKDFVLMGETHCSRMERHDLVMVHIGSRKALGGITVSNGGDVLGVDASLVKCSM